MCCLLLAEECSCKLRHAKLFSILQAILEDLSQAKKIPSEKLKRQPVLVGASGIAAIAGLTALVAASAQVFS